MSILKRRKFIKDTALSAAMLFTASLTEVDEDDTVEKTVKPFLHGVASGDPQSTKVIIWTRISTDHKDDLKVTWTISKDNGITEVVQTGEVLTNASKDYTVKVDVAELVPSTTYFYQFTYEDLKSPVGRTKTTPSGDLANLQFAVVSCTDYSAGYYSALARISERKDLAAVIHLGDYIYEGTTRKFDPTPNPGADDYELTHFNRTRSWWLHYYRMRYSINRFDPDLQAAHQVHPFITVWDDHEVANNAWSKGARDHQQERDGEWEIRKSAAQQAYSEWMPIRGDGSKVYRSIRFGNLAELILLDTRLEGRDQQVYNYTDPALFAPGRTILGKEQKRWLFDQLDGSECLWKLVTSQVIFSEINVQWAPTLSPKAKLLQDTVLDYWEGYPDERDEVIQHIADRKLNNVVILSASMHCALAFDVTKRATNYSRKGQTRTYDPVTSKGSVAVEFSAPSVTSANFDEMIGSFYATAFQSLLNKKLPAPFGYNPNPHLKFADLQRHGYIILNITREKAEARFHFVDDLMERNKKETAGEKWFTQVGRNKLQSS